MALTVPQLEAHLGRFLRLAITSVTTSQEIAALREALPFLLAAGKRYIPAGTLGTQAERLEAMITARNACVLKVEGIDADASPDAAHTVANHLAPQYEVRG